MIHFYNSFSNKWMFNSCYFMHNHRVIMINIVIDQINLVRYSIIGVVDVFSLV